jgi:hypothetical protein
MMHLPLKSVYCYEAAMRLPETFPHLAVLHYAGSEQRKHHEIEWFFATTFDRIGRYHYRGNAELPYADLKAYRIKNAFNLIAR